MSPSDARGGAGRSLALGAMIAALVLAMAGLAAVGGGTWWLVRSYAAPGPGTTPVVLLAPRGATLPRIARDLEAAGAIRDARVFRVAVRVFGDPTSLQAGEYAIPAGASMRAIYERMRDGDVVRYSVTIAEGLTSQAAVEAVNAVEVLSGTISATPPEGALLPETYQVTRGETRRAVIARMVAARTALLEELWAGRAPNLPFATPEEAVILASIVEREAGGSEHDLVASVFVNRLRRGMRLEADATILYGLTGGEPLLDANGARRGIRRSELDDATNPYNTYQIDGLPPTPIANPGAAALRGVLNPPATNALFFVADGTGGHAFAATYAEHQANVARWRQIERARQAEAG